MMNHAVGGCVFPHLPRPEGPLQEVNYRLSPQRMHVHVHGVQSLRNVVLALVRSDIPEVSRRIFHATRALAILLIPGLINGRSARSQSLLINRIAIRNVEMDGMGIGGSPELAPRN